MKMNVNLGVVCCRDELACKQRKQSKQKPDEPSTDEPPNPNRHDSKKPTPPSTHRMLLLIIRELLPILMTKPQITAISYEPVGWLL